MQASGLAGFVADPEATEPGGATASDRAMGLAFVLLGLSLGLAGTLLVSPLIGMALGEFGFVPGFTWQEALDLLTPLVVLPLFWLAIERAGGLGTKGRLAFLVAAGAWASAHGMHLAANAVTDAFADPRSLDMFLAIGPGNLDHFLDEVLSHWEWHVAWVALLALLPLAVARAAGPVQLGRRVAVVAGLAGLVHGFTWFFVTTEGETWALGIPAAALFGAWALAGRSAVGRRRVLVVAAAASALTSLVLWMAWIGMCGWPPASIFEFLTTGACPAPILD